VPFPSDCTGPGNWTEKMNTTNIDSIFLDPTAAAGSARRYRGVSGNLPLYSADGVIWHAEQNRWTSAYAGVPLCSCFRRPSSGIAMTFFRCSSTDPLFQGDWGTTGFGAMINNTCVPSMRCIGHTLIAVVWCVDRYTVGGILGPAVRLLLILHAV
jgi:hypothetical protein